MERTESTVVQTAPDCENAKSEEMQRFGWSLQGRQEIHERGDAYGRPSFISDRTYVTKIEVSKYVKLHFSRSLALPNIEQIRGLEAEYFAVPFPTFPAILPGGFGLIIFWYPLWPFYFFLSYKPKTAKAEKDLTAALERQRQLLEQVARLN